MTWRERLAHARTAGAPTEDDLRRAWAWSTCAVGEQHAAAPDVVVYIPGRYVYVRVPLDPTLSKLGAEFTAVVSGNRLSEAEAILDQIDDRVLELKRERGNA